MRRTLAAWALLATAGCKTNDEGAVLALLEVDERLGATCARLEVLSGDVVGASAELSVEPLKTSYKVGLMRGALPATVTLRARAFRSADGCAEPRQLLALSAPRAITFPSKGVERATLTLAPPDETLDGDRDGFIAQAHGGDDCDDTNPSIHPGAAQDCSSAADTDCDAQAGCADSDCVAHASCTSASTQLAFATPPATASVGACSSALELELRDGSQTPSPAAQALTVALSANPQGPRFYADPACSAEITQVPIAAGQSRASFHFKAPAAGAFTLTATAEGLSAVSQAQQVSAAGIVFTTPARTVIAGACSQAFTLTSRDASSAPLPVAAPVDLALAASPATGLTFYRDDGCGEAVDTVTLDTGFSEVSFFVRALKAGAIEVSATPAGASAVTQNLTVTPAAAAKLVFTSLGQGIALGACSSEVTFTPHDAFGNESGAAAAVTVTGGAGVSLFIDTACSTALSGPISLSSGQPVGRFFFRGAQAGTRTLTLSAQGLSSASQAQTIGAGAAARLAFVTAAQSVRAGDCSQALTVQAQDTGSSPVNLQSSLTVSLSALPGAAFSFHATPACGAAITSTVVAAGSSGATVYFRGTRAGSVGLTASASGLLSATQSVTLTPAAAAALAFTSAAQTIGAGSCGAAFTVQLRDAFGNPVSAGANLPLALTSSAGATGQTFFANPNCSGGAMVRIAGGQSSVNFGVRPTQVGAFTLSATSGALGAATQALTVIPGAASKLAFLNPALTAKAGQCSTPLTVQRRDALDNPAAPASLLSFSLSGTPDAGFSFHLMASCSDVAVGTASIAAGSSTRQVYFRGTRAGTVTVAASASGLQAASQVETVTAGDASRLAIVSPPRTLEALSCSSAVTVELADAFGNRIASAPAAVSVGLSASGAATSFSSSSACSGSVSSVTLAQGTSAVDFYFRPLDAGTATLTVAAAGLLSDSQAQTVLAPQPSALALSTAATTLETGACVAVTVTRLNALGQPTAWASATDVSLSVDTGLAAYSDANCVNDIEELSIGSGSAAAGFYLKALTAGPASLGAASGAMQTSLSLTRLPMVRRGSCTLSATAMAVACPITPALSDISRTFLVFQAVSADDTSNGSNVTCGLEGVAGAAVVSCARMGVGAGSVANIAWQTASFARSYAQGGVSVQHLRQTWGTNPSQPVTVPLGQAVDAGDSFTLFSTRTAGSINAEDDSYTARLFGNRAELRVSNTVTSIIDGGVALQVVSFANAKVERPSANLGMSAASGYSNLGGLPAADLGRTLLLYSSRVALMGGSTPDLCDLRLRGYLDGTGAVAFGRSNWSLNTDCMGPALEAIEFERVQLPFGHQVVSQSALINDGNLEVYLSWPGGFDVSRTFFLSGGQGPSGQGQGEVLYKANDVLGASQVLTLLDPQEDPLIRRGAALGNANFTLWFVQLAP